MITFNDFTLSNGLQVIHHFDASSRLCVLNVLYKVGSKNENPEKTGFAHLFEHLMFGGSKHVPDFDTVLQQIGGDNNAFTSNDFTNYYITVPSNNIETAFWIESDRMLALDFNQKSLDVQKSVVIEEFKERYLNQPYGDVWLQLLPLAYKNHPYQWPTIGKEISHIETATLEDVKDFFYSYYAPNNAVLILCGNISLEETKRLSEKWFGDIETRNVPAYNPVKEPVQLEKRTKHIYSDVPVDLLVMAFPICERVHADFYAIDLLTDILGSGKSSRLYSRLLKERNIFSEIDCYHSGDAEAGLLIIEGKLSLGITLEQAENEVWIVLNDLIKTGIDEQELIKVKNKTETNIRFNDIGVLNKAMKLAYASYYGNLDLVNTEADNYLLVTTNQIMMVAKSYLLPEHSNVLYYHSKNGAR
ncbi:MAG: insulinase family protein [Bacteroidia bacterium]|nr:insulinase family protein [Bacteroidia bacterium]